MLRFAKRKRPRIAIHLTALIDIVFLLLIYFLLTSEFVEREGIPVDLPRMQRPEMAEGTTTTVVIDGQGLFHFRNQTVTEAELGRLLRSAVLEDAEAAVTIMADRGVVYDRVVRALDIAKESGARQLHLSVEKREEKR
jgi:biopolymer transport protein ExbD